MPRRYVRPQTCSVHTASSVGFSIELSRGHWYTAPGLTIPDPAPDVQLARGAPTQSIVVINNTIYIDELSFIMRRKTTRSLQSLCYILQLKHSEASNFGNTSNRKDIKFPGIKWSETKVFMAFMEYLTKFLSFCGFQISGSNAFGSVNILEFA